ncbi:MAG TPA: hypothetical protein VK431_02000 [Nitrosopumilaceae archaeon]|nr:hypothetical protein [Nitrosopumilaceae archaeon]
MLTLSLCTHADTQNDKNKQNSSNNNELRSPQSESPTNITNYNTYNNTEINPSFVNTASNTTLITVKIEEIITLINQTIKETVNKEQFNNAQKIIQQLLWNHRFTIIGGVLFGSYGVTNLLLLTDFYQLDNNLFWAHWKKNCTFEFLCATPQRELAKELLLAIGQHHYNENHPTDLAFPLVNFIKTIENEIITIKRYIFIAKSIKKLHLMPIFTVTETKIAKAEKLLEKVLFIKHIFLSWLAEYNLASTEKLNG